MSDKYEFCKECGWFSEDRFGDLYCPPWQNCDVMGEDMDPASDDCPKNEIYRAENPEEFEDEDEEAG